MDRSFLQVYIKSGWKKLDKNDALLTSAAYVDTVIFHPWVESDELSELSRVWVTSNGDLLAL
jgi:hypothetical protein